MSAEPARMTAAAAHQRHVFASTRGRERVSLDVPSGIDATTGETPGVAVLARATLTLALPKTGCGSPAAGELWLADLGIPMSVYDAVGVPYADPIGARWRVWLRIHPRPNQE
jgi:NAD(P)H-hydrate epimerase